MPADERTTAQIWDRRYGEAAALAFGAEPNAFLSSHRDRLRPGMRAFLPGDGEGRNGLWLARHGLAVVSVDASSVGVARARARADEAGVTLDARVGDLEDWDWPAAAFDLVASIFVHFPKATRAGLHRRMAETMKPGGLLILECYGLGQIERRKSGTHGGPPPEMLVTPDDLASDFAMLEIEMLAEVETVLAEGVRHVGPSSVVRLVARRDR